jgi:hypothetical protein
MSDWTVSCFTLSGKLAVLLTAASSLSGAADVSGGENAVFVPCAFIVSLET